MQHEPFEWLVANGETERNFQWQRVAFPFTFSNEDFSTAFSGMYLQNGQKVNVLPRIGDIHSVYNTNALVLDPRFFPTGKIMTTASAQMQLLPIWERHPTQAQRHVATWTSSFPPEYHQVCGIQFQNYRIEHKRAACWNPANRVVQCLDQESWEWSESTLAKSFDPLEHKHILLSRKAMACAWLMRCLEENRTDLWQGLKEREAHFLENVWNLIFEDAARNAEGSWTPILFWTERFRMRLYVLSPEGWLQLDNPSGYEQYRPEVSEGWLLRIERPYVPQ